VNFNNPNDSSTGGGSTYPGPNYTTPADAVVTIQRKGPITRLALTGNLTASRANVFGSIASQGWQAGDVVFVEYATHTGGGFTVSFANLAATTVLTTWGPLLANGAMFVFDGVDFHATIPGASAT
jgi:hypothetical protein